MNKDIKKTSGFVRSYYWSIFFKNKKYSPAVFLNIPLTILTVTLVPLLASKIFDDLSTGRISDITSLRSALIPLGLSMLIYILIMLIRDLFRSRYATNAAYLIQEDTRSHLFKMSETFFGNNFAGSLHQNLNRLSNNFPKFIDIFMIGIFENIMIIAITATILYSRSPLLLLVLAPSIILYSFVPVIIKRKNAKLIKMESEQSNILDSHLGDSLSGYSIVKANGREAEELRFIQAKTVNWGVVSIRRRDFNNSAYKINRVIDTLTRVGVIYLSASLYLNGTVGIGTVLLVQAYVMSILSALRSIPEAVISFGDIYAETSKMAEIMMTEPEIKDPENPVNLKIKDGQIEFQGANFKYTNSSEEVKEDEDARPARQNKKEQAHLFKNLDLTIKPGERIGLVGPSGGGKSTLLKLILRFYDVDSGSIKIDGVDVKDVIQSKLRQQIAYVPQDPALFHRSIGENIGYSKPKAKQSQIEQAAKQAYADEFINTLPDGYDTLVGERGVKLSGGQRQRVAIARAILKDAPILLLDEATSALDSESERYIQKSLEKLMKGRTTVVVAHRLSTIQKMDRILVIDGGKVIASGPHEELLKTSPLYKKLWSHQSGGMLQD